MESKELILTKKTAIVEVIRDFDDSYMKLTWPVGTQLSVDLDDYIKGGVIARYTAGHGVHLSLFKEHVKPLRGLIEKTIIESETFIL